MLDRCTLREAAALFCRNKFQNNNPSCNIYSMLCLPISVSLTNSFLVHQFLTPYSLIRHVSRKIICGCSFPILPFFFPESVALLWEMRKMTRRWQCSPLRKRKLFHIGCTDGSDLLIKLNSTHGIHRGVQSSAANYKLNWPALPLTQGGCMVFV